MVQQVRQSIWVWGVSLSIVAMGAVWLVRYLVPHYDVVLFQEWTRAAQQFGYTNLRAVSSFNYLAPFTGVLWLSNLFESAWASFRGGVDFLQYWRFFAFSLEIVLLIWLISVSKSLLNQKQLRWLIALMLFHPVFFWVMGVWGQIDMLIILPWLTSLFYLVQKRYFGFFVASFFALCFKPTGILLLPLSGLLLIITLLHHSKYRRLLSYGPFVILGVSMVLLSFLPLIARFLSELQNSTSQTYLTYNAYNIWFVLPNFGYSQDMWQGLSYQMWSALGLLAVLSPFFYVLFRLIARKISIEQILFAYISFSALYAFLFTLILTDMHERYWDFALAAFLVGALLYRPWIGISIVLSITFFLNFILIFPSTFPPFVALQSNWVVWGKLISQFHIALVLILFAIWVRAYWQIKKRSHV